MCRFQISEVFFFIFNFFFYMQPFLFTKCCIILWGIIARLCQKEAILFLFILLEENLLHPLMFSLFVPLLFPSSALLLFF